MDELLKLKSRTIDTACPDRPGYGRTVPLHRRPAQGQCRQGCRTPAEIPWMVAAAEGSGIHCPRDHPAVPAATAAAGLRSVALSVGVTPSRRPPRSSGPCQPPLFGPGRLRDRPVCAKPVLPSGRIPISSTGLTAGAECQPELRTQPNLRNDTPTPAQTIQKNRSPNLLGLATGERNRKERRTTSPAPSSWSP